MNQQTTAPQYSLSFFPTLATPGPTAMKTATPAAAPAVALPVISAPKELGFRVAPSEATRQPNARTVVFHLDPTAAKFPRTAPHSLLRRLLALLGVGRRFYAVHRPVGNAVFCIDETNALALRISEEAAQLDMYHGGFTPAHAALIARRELGRNTAPTSPTTVEVSGTGAAHRDFIRYKRTVKLTSLTAKRDRLTNKHYPGDELSAHFPLGCVGSAGRASAKLNSRKSASMDKMIDDSLEIKRLNAEISKVQWHLNQPAKETKPAKAVREKPVPTERERKIYTWYFYGKVEEMPDEDWTETEVRAVRTKFRNGLNLSTTPPAPAADDIALLTEHQAAEYLRTANDDQPDELISARHGEPAAVLTPAKRLRAYLAAAPQGELDARLARVQALNLPGQPAVSEMAATFAPAAELTPAKPQRKFPFSALRLAGHRVTVLHQVGKCAVAKVFPCEGRAPYFAARFRQHYAEFGHLREAGRALQALRRLDNAEIRRENEVFTVTDALDQLALSPSCLGRFCHLHDLDVGRSYTRRELRRAITDRRQPKMPVYLSLLNRLTTTNPA